MPPLLALSFCTIFVLYLLHLDRQQAPQVSPALWIPTIWMVSTSTKPLGLWFPSFAPDAISGSPLDQILHGSLLCIGLMVLAHRRFGWSHVLKEQVWLMVLVGYMFISIMWSEIPFVSFKRWVREMPAVIMAFLVLTEQNPRMAALTVFRRSIYMLIPFSLVLVKYFPDFGVEFGRWSGARTWIGVAMQKNGLGRLCVIAVFFLVWEFFRRRHIENPSRIKHLPYANGMVLAIALWLLIGPPDSYSATAVGSLCTGLAVLFGMVWMKNKHANLGKFPLTFFLFLGIFFGTVTLFLGGITLADFTSTLGRDETLTGRTEVWSELLPTAMQEPFGGHGFGGFWTTQSRERYEISEGHSGYLDVLLDLGFIGLFLNVAFLLSSSRKAQKEFQNDFPWAVMWIGFLAIAVIHNITESSLGSFTRDLTAVLIFLAVCSTTSNSHAGSERISDHPGARQR